MADDLLDTYMTLCGGTEKPSTPEEKEAAMKLSGEKKEFLKKYAEERGYKSPKELQKELDKLMKKVQPSKPKPEKQSKPGNAAKKKVEHDENEVLQEDLEDMMRRTLGKPEDNVGAGDYFVNPPERLQKHLNETGGKYQLRFPPEPNGWLHIGHAKAMSVNFGFARANNGNCYLRFDDTNPEAEKQEYIDGIVENVAWLGYHPFKVTYTSDYFDQLYDLACELIRRGKAYVCFFNEDQVKAQRNALKDYHNAHGRGEDVSFPSEAVYDKAREDTTPEENLQLFEQMKDGKFEEGEVSLRMKGDFHSPNPNMWDHMAYRIKKMPHPRTQDKWCIYPTYDYSHCLVDSIENVTHSLCTLEFETRQASNSSYHWLVDALGMYHAKTYETSRCSVSYNVMSKRRLHKLVHEGYVNGWDDPRLLTLAGLRRRGYTPTSITTFCRKLGFARTSNEVCVSANILEGCIRAELDIEAPRRFGVLDPIKLIIENYEPQEPSIVPNHPTNPAMGTREIALTKTISIPGEKFRLDMVKGYKGMVPGSESNSSIKLMNSRVVTYISHKTNENGKVTEIVARMEAEDFPHKGMSVVVWVPENAVAVSTNIYGRLFKDCEIADERGILREVHAEKAAKEKGVEFTELFNKNSLNVADMLVEPGMLGEIQERKVHAWQLITVGYFCVDTVDSTPEKPVLNMTVSLKEDKSKAANN